MYHADSGETSIASTFVTMIDKLSRHLHSLRLSVAALAITIALIGNRVGGAQLALGFATM